MGICRFYVWSLCMGGFLCMRFYVCMRFQASLGGLGAPPPSIKGRLLYLLFICIDFPLLDISRKWSHIIHAFLFVWLSSLNIMLLKILRAFEDPSCFWVQLTFELCSWPSAQLRICTFTVCPLYLQFCILRFSQPHCLVLTVLHIY